MGAPGVLGLVVFRVHGLGCRFRSMYSSERCLNEGSLGRGKQGFIGSVTLSGTFQNFDRDGGWDGLEGSGV